jgi:hypothetical protein
MSSIFFKMGELDIDDTKRIKRCLFIMIISVLRKIQILVKQYLLHLQNIADNLQLKQDTELFDNYYKSFSYTFFIPSSIRKGVLIIFCCIFCCVFCREYLDRNGIKLDLYFIEVVVEVVDYCFVKNIACNKK